MLRIVALTPLCKNNTKETVYIDINSEQDSHWLLITVAHVLSHASSYGICGGQSGTMIAFSPVTSDSDVPCRYIPPVLREDISFICYRYS